MSARIQGRRGHVRPKAAPMVSLRASTKPRPAVKSWLRTFLLDQIF